MTINLSELLKDAANLKRVFEILEEQKLSFNVFKLSSVSKDFNVTLAKEDYAVVSYPWDNTTRQVVHPYKTVIFYDVKE